MTTEKPELQPYKRINKAITLEEKLTILKELEAGASRREIEEIFKCSQSTISRVLLSRETLLQMSDSDIAGNGIKDPAVMSNKEIDEALTAWAYTRKQHGEAITPDMVKLKAEELCKESGQTFLYSTYWLYKWKDRKNIRFTKNPLDTECTGGKERNEEILKGLLNKGQEEVNEEQQIKKLKLENNEQSGLILKRYKDKQAEAESLNSSLDAPNKSRTKREYIRRMPAFMKTEGGSQYPGTIYRSRKEKTFLTLLQKLEILQRLKNGERRPDLIIEYKLSQSAMSQIVSDEHKIQKLAAGGQNLQMKRVRGGIFKDGEAELNSWVQDKMKIGESLTRTQIKNKAKEIGDRLHIDFKASTGWLEKWKARMNLDFNENQILHRKIPSYIANENDGKNYEKLKHPTEITNELNDEELLFPNLVKQEILESNDDEDNDDYDQEQNEDDYSYDESIATDIKPEFLTPQEFYIQTLQNDKQQQLPPDPVHEEEPEDIKPVIDTPPHLMPVSAYQEESLHGQLLKWFNTYKVSPVAATELLNILHPHLNSIVKPPNLLTPLPKNHRYT